jgi:hypothetical protein
MAGVFHPLPDEIYNILASEHPIVFKTYAYAIARFHVEEDWDRDGSWVVGKIYASWRDITNKLHISRGGLYECDGIGRLRDLGLISDEGDGAITLNMLKKKEDAIISLSQIRRMERDIQELKEIIFPEEPPGGAEPGGGDTFLRARKMQNDIDRIKDAIRPDQDGEKNSGGGKKIDPPSDPSTSGPPDQGCVFDSSPGECGKVARKPRQSGAESAPVIHNFGSASSFKIEIDMGPPSIHGSDTRSGQQTSCQNLAKPGCTPDDVDKEEKKRNGMDGWIFSQNGVEEDQEFYSGARSPGENAIKQLRYRGVDEGRARKLVERYGADRVCANVVTVDRDSSLQTFRNIPGLICWRIENDYASRNRPKEQPDIREEPEKKDPVEDRIAAEIDEALSRMSSQDKAALEKQAKRELKEAGVTESVISELVIDMKQRQILRIRFGYEDGGNGSKKPGRPP